MKLFPTTNELSIIPEVRLMNDSTEGRDGAKEIIMDYVVSWTLRRAQNICASEKPILYRYCRRFLSLLLNQELSDQDQVFVETWKQEQRIDLWVYAVVNGVKHDILIEDKYYSPLHDDQLTRYKEYFDTWIKDNRRDTNPHYYILSCMDRSDEKIRQYENQGFELICWNEMIDAMKCNYTEPSESDIFNEFWIYWE